MNLICVEMYFFVIDVRLTVYSLSNPPTDEGRFKDDYMEGQGTMKMNENVIIAKHKEEANDDEASKEEATEKNDWMIPLQFQSDISHIHQKAGFTQVGL